MIDNMLVLTGLGLLLHWMPPVTPAKIDPTSQVIHLDMAENSVDDVYFECFNKMTDAVEKKIFPEEMKDEKFSRVWKMQEKCANDNMKKQKDETALTKNHMQAICLFTEGGRDTFYKPFNEAVRTGGPTYTTSFHYHSFHFWLTSAIQSLNDQQQCYHTFRRTPLVFESQVHEKIRFGYFASSSLLTDLTHFGKETCFCISTCYGAYLKTYSKQKDREQEVLIPPYEIFKVTKKNDRKCLPGCQVRYSLESVGILSNQNCKVVDSLD